MNPYENLPIEKWKDKTIELVKKHPLKKEELVESVLSSWDKIFDTYIGNELKIGREIKPSPQILGNYLHELIPIYFEKKYNGKWHKDKTKNDKDLVCDFDNFFSIEIKTSSSKKDIFGNRSYGIQSEAENTKKKEGYYLAINFEKCTEEVEKPDITLIRFGWLEHTDWISQNAQTGQQSRLSKESDSLKFIILYEKR